ncbi:MAG: T9SS type A sorting domain-containing protein [Flavobacteriales bacterium]|nr:T9SS type A sorting domain-containing protein [Flavobacteriales bacterium]
MRSLFFFAIAMGFAQIALSQITITASDLPNTDSVYVRATAANLGDFDFVSTGENFTWDFSELGQLNTTVTEFQEISEAPFAYQFLFNNPFDPDHIADMTIETEGFDTGQQINFDEFYQFFQKNDNAWSIVGYGTTISGIPLPAQTEPVDVVYDLPIEFGNTHENYSEWLIEVPDFATYKLKQDRSYEVDGHGTLILPDASYDVLRLRMQIDAVDSIVIPLLQVDFELDRNSVEYIWLAEGQGTPVLQATETLGQVAFVNYKTNDLPDNILEEERVSKINLYPNPAQDILWANSENEIISGIRILDQTGKLVLNELVKTSLARIDISGLEAGSYIVEVTTELGVERKQLIKQ